MRTEDDVSQKRLAAVFGVTTREIYNLRQKGLPARPEGGKIVYPLSECVPWYARYRESLARSGSDAKSRRDELAAKNFEIEIRLKELELAREEGAVVTLEYMEQQVGGCLERLRARLLASPSRYAPQFVGLKTTAEARIRLDALVSELMLSLTEVGEDEELDAEDPEAAA